MNETPTLKRTLEWFQKATPTPDAKSVSSQLGCHFEEVVELLQALGLPHLELLEVSLDLKQGHYTQFLEDTLVNPSTRTEVLDALGDQLVTATGSAHVLNMDIIGALDEINRSNFTKFDKDENPIKNENGKIMKGEFYTQPELETFANPA